MTGLRQWNGKVTPHITFNKFEDNVGRFGRGSLSEKLAYGFVLQKYTGEMRHLKAKILYLPLFYEHLGREMFPPSPHLLHWWEIRSKKKIFISQRALQYIPDRESRGAPDSQSDTPVSFAASPITRSGEFCQKMKWPLSRSSLSAHKRHANGVRAENTLAEFAWARQHYYQHHLHIDQEPRLWEINLINVMLQLGL